VQIEFNPFIIPNESMGTKSKKTKLRELVTTVVAFANKQGGRIYIGIDDECDVSGINPELQQWAKAEVDEESIERYRGALTNKIKDKIEGDASVRVSYTAYDDLLVFIVDVEQSTMKPVKVRGDNTFYVRTGASNQQLPPEQWESVLGGNIPKGGLSYGTG
jgi:predicted HTH transcriptional regulator